MPKPLKPLKHQTAKGDHELAYLRSFSNPERALTHILESTVPNAIAGGARLEYFAPAELRIALSTNLTVETFTPLNLPIRFVAALAEYSAYHALQRVSEFMAGDGPQANEAYRILTALRNAATVLDSIPEHHLSREAAQFRNWILDFGIVPLPSGTMLHWNDLRLRTDAVHDQLLLLRQQALLDRLREYGLAQACRSVGRVMFNGLQGMAAIIEFVRQIPPEDRLSLETVTNQALAIKVRTSIETANPFIADDAWEDAVWLANYRGCSSNDVLTQAHCEAGLPDDHLPINRALLRASKDYTRILEASLDGNQVYSAARNERPPANPDVSLTYHEIWISIALHAYMGELPPGGLNEIARNLATIGFRDTEDAFKQHNASAYEHETRYIVRFVRRNIGHLSLGNGFAHFAQECSFVAEARQCRETLCGIGSTLDQTVRMLVNSVFSSLGHDDRSTFSKAIKDYLAAGRLLGENRACEKLVRGVLREKAHEVLCTQSSLPASRMKHAVQRDRGISR